MSDGETLIYTGGGGGGGEYHKVVGTLHCALENGSNLHVNERQKTRHYRARSTEEEQRRRMPNGDFYFARRICKLHYYGDGMHSFNWKSTVQHDGGV